MAKHLTAFSSGMRGNEKGKKEVRGVSIDKADNGHTVRVHHDSTGGEYVPSTESVFADEDTDKMVKHVLSSLGVKHKKQNDDNHEAGDCPFCGK
jgi:hypothetical protein